MHVVEGVGDVSIVAFGGNVYVSEIFAKNNFWCSNALVNNVVSVLIFSVGCMDP